MAINKTNAKRSEVLKSKRGMGRSAWAATNKLKVLGKKQAKNISRRRLGHVPKPKKILNK